MSQPQGHRLSAAIACIALAAACGPSARVGAGGTLIVGRDLQDVGAQAARAHNLDVVVAEASAPSQPFPLDAALKRAWSLYRDFEFTAAVTELRSAEASLKGASGAAIEVAQVRELYLLIASAELAQARTAGARAATGRAAALAGDRDVDTSMFAPDVVALYREQRADLMRRPRATLRVTARPAIADVSVDGARLPAEGTIDLMPGPHVVTATSFGHRPLSRLVEVTGAGIDNLALELAPLDSGELARGIVDLGPAGLGALPRNDRRSLPGRFSADVLWSVRRSERGFSGTRIEDGTPAQTAEISGLPGEAPARTVERLLFELAPPAPRTSALKWGLWAGGAAALVVTAVAVGMVAWPMDGTRVEVLPNP